MARPPRLRSRVRLGALGCLAFASCLISRRYRTTPTGHWPLLALLFALPFCGALLWFAYRRLPWDNSAGEGYTSQDLPGRSRDEPLKDATITATSFKTANVVQTAKAAVSWALWRWKVILQGAVLAAAVGGRLWILQTVVMNIECASRPLESLLPFLLAILEFLFPKPAAEILTPIGAKFTGDSLSLSSEVAKWRHLQLLLSTLGIAMGALLLNTWQPMSTSFICPENSYSSVQMSGVLMDAAILFWVARQISEQKSARSAVHACARTIISISLGLIVTSVVSVLKNEEFKEWIARLLTRFLVSTIFDAALVSTLVASAVVLLLEISTTAVCGTSMLVILATQHTSLAWTGYWNFMPNSGFIDIMFVFCLFYAATVIFNEEIASDTLTIGTNIQGLINKLLLLACILLAAVFGLGNTINDHHPIDGLMAQAKVTHQEWLADAKSSSGLRQAVETYQTRHQRSPPPHFDKWYQYASFRNSTVIDNYDQIWKDLLPFTAMKPADIRNATSEILSNEWNDLGGLIVRGGNLYISENIRGTHRWMFDGIAAMINNFAWLLPDMDLAFNLDDECRVAAPREQMLVNYPLGNTVGTALRSGSDTNYSSNMTEWSPDWMIRNASEADVSEEPSQRFPNRQFRSSFHEAATSHCSSQSPARKDIIWNPTSPCPTCSAPFSDGQFISDWILSNDVCLQPDSAHTHGFHLAPSTFKTAHSLVPIFSQSKVGGYADILYPSPWNYIGKASYDSEKSVAFEAKEDVLFWRGATSEGKSFGHRWRGMQRQRFVYLANNITNSSSTPVLVPHGHKTYKYTNLPHGEVMDSLTVKVDAGIVSRIDRCHGPACDEQLRDLRITEPVDFQDHWKYKYLMDLDGAGFSGRFIPFLRSASVPIKAALFREWYDDRLVPWLHFVPIDGRFNGLWSILAYFGGWNEGEKGGKQTMKKRDVQAKWIAEQGQSFAKQMLRKEDMEIYFFRLLLEYARVVDDNRDGIGFVMDT